MQGLFQFVKSNFRWLAGGLLLTVFSSFGQTFYISLFSKQIRKTFDLTDGNFGTIYMIATPGERREFGLGWKAGRSLSRFQSCVCRDVVFVAGLRWNVDGVISSNAAGRYLCFAPVWPRHDDAHFANGDGPLVFSRTRSRNFIDRDGAPSW